jgi:PadR family transcriptional regulator PadR
VSGKSYYPRPTFHALGTPTELFYGHYKGTDVISFALSKGTHMAHMKSEVLQGTLDLMVLKTLEALGPIHGYGIARRLEQTSEELLRLNEGTVYTALVRLGQKGWITSKWGASENNRRARYYSITKAGRKRLVREAEDWARISAVVDRVLRLQSQE